MRRRREKWREREKREIENFERMKFYE